MKRIIAVLTIFAVLAGAEAAFATGSVHHNTTINGGGGEGGNATSNATGGNATANGGTHIQTNTQNTTNIVAPTQNSTQVQGQGQSQKSTQRNRQSTSVNVDASSGDTPRQAPSMAIMGSVSNASCLAHVGGGATTPFGGLSLMVPKLDEGCDSRAFADRLMHYGFQEEAIELMRAHDKVEKAFQAAEKRRNGAKAAVKAEPTASLKVNPDAHVSAPKADTQGN